MLYGSDRQAIIKITTGFYKRPRSCRGIIYLAKGQIENNRFL